MIYLRTTVKHISQRRCVTRRMAINIVSMSKFYYRSILNIVYFFFNLLIVWEVAFLFYKKKWNFCGKKSYFKFLLLCVIYHILYLFIYHAFFFSLSLFWSRWRKTLLSRFSDIRSSGNPPDKILVNRSDAGYIWPEDLERRASPRCRHTWDVSVCADRCHIVIGRHDDVIARPFVRSGWFASAIDTRIACLSMTRVDGKGKSTERLALPTHSRKDLAIHRVSVCSSAT